MLVNNTIVEDPVDVSKDTLTEIFKYLDINEGVPDEDLGLVANNTEIYKVLGDDSDFSIEGSLHEYRCIHEDDIEKIFEVEISEVYDEYYWRDTVSAGNTTLGYDDWINEVIDESDYGTFFASYDGTEDTLGKYYIFRVM